jgi:hypothetical protein
MGDGKAGAGFRAGSARSARSACLGRAMSNTVFPRWVLKKTMLDNALLRKSQ